MEPVDLLSPLLLGAARGDVVLPTGATSAGWHAYGGSRMGELVAHEDRVADGSAQNGRVLHVRTAPNGSRGRPGAPEFLRVHTERHVLHPTVHCSFRIEQVLDAPARRSGFAVRLMLCHQDNLTAYHCSLRLDGVASIVKEGRDGADPRARGIPARNLGTGTWEPMLGEQPSVRHHLRAGVVEDGTVWLQVDDAPVLAVVDPWLVPSGQVGFRLDGIETSLHSMVVSGPSSGPPAG